MIACQRETTAKYIFFVGASVSEAKNQFRFREIKAFSEVEIGRNVISVTPAYDANSEDPLKCTIGEVSPAYANKTASFAKKEAKYSFASE